MMPNEGNFIYYLAGLLVAVIGYFLADAHTQIKDKADKEVLKEAIETWRADLRESKAESQREAERMERQYEVKFAGVVADLSNRINSVETNLVQRMELILQLLGKNK
jgi:hypothetical protein